MRELIIVIVFLIILVLVLSTIILRRRISLFDRKVRRLTEDLEVAITGGGISVWKYYIKKDRYALLRGTSIFPEGSNLLHCEEYIHPNYRPKSHEAMMSLMKGEQESVGYNSYVFNPELREYRHMSCHISLIRKRGEPILIIGTYRDITEDVLTKKKLEDTSIKYRAVFDNAMIGLKYYDKNGMLTDINQAAMKIFGITSPDRLMKLQKSIFTHPFLKEFTYPGAHITSPVEKMVNYDFDKINSSDFAYGSSKTGVSKLLYKICPLLDANDSSIVEGYVVAVSDQTESIKYQNEIKASNELMKASIDQLPTVLFVKDIKDDFRYIIANSYFCEMVGKPESEIVGKTEFEIFTHEDAVKFRKDDERAVNSNEPYSFQEETMWRGIRTIWKTTKFSTTLANGRSLMIGIGVNMEC